jgi:aminopeptidase N
MRTRRGRRAIIVGLAGLLSMVCLGLTGGACAQPEAPAVEHQPFAPAGQQPNYPSNRLFHLEHVRLDLAFDLRQRSVSGTATNDVTPLLPGLDHLVFHAAGLEVARVRLAGVAGDLAFVADAASQTLLVRLPRAFGPQDRLQVAIDYSARPRAGLFVTGPDRFYPDRPWQMFSDGEPQLNRYWFPSWDEPDDRATSELVATVPRPFEVIGNGRLVEVLDRADGRRTFHWRMEQPHSTYLISVVIGEFSHTRDSWHGIPIETAVPLTLAERAPRTFGRTADMMDFISGATGVPFPYARYSQAAVNGFMWEGMENISATTETADALRDARAELDADSDDLVSHELAHQWFGDYVTCRTWADAWLNEGFATYFEALYEQHRKGGAAGDDELAWQVDTARADYFLEDREHYRRPLVTSRYVDPVRMFDAHTYDKGALVLHMLHARVGEDGWRRGLHLYLTRHALGDVTSADLEAAFEDASGVELRELFDQFVYGAGYPALTVKWSYEATAARVHLEVRQTQGLTADTGLFSFPVEVELLDGGSAAGSGQAAAPPAIHTVAIAAREVQDLYVPSATAPAAVVFDPRGVLLKSLNFDKPAAEWIAQLAAPLPLAAHLDAARALGELGGDEAVAALGKALLRHRFYGLREVAAAALAQIGSGAALAALEQGLRDADPKVRAAVLAALGSYSDHAELIPLLRRALEGDASYAARAAAAGALGHFLDRRREVTPLLLKALHQKSYLEEIPRAAIKALAELDAPETLPRALELARYGSPPAARADAMQALARFAAQATDDRVRREARRALEAFLDDADFEVRQRVPEALADLGDAAAVPALERSMAAEVQDEQRHTREAAIWKLQHAGTKPAATPSTEDRIRHLEQVNESLRERLRQLEDEHGAAPETPAKPPAAVQPAPPSQPKPAAPSQPATPGLPAAAQPEPAAPPPQ